MSDVRESAVVVDGVHSPVLESGPENADEAVVYVHGNPGCARDWIGLLPETGKLLRSVALDLPGYGGAARPRDFPYDVAAYSQHLAGAIDSLGIKRVHLVCHDFGGAFGLVWALAHPQALRTLTLIDIGVLPGYEWHYAARIWRTPVVGELSQRTLRLAPFRLAMKRDNPRELPREFVEQAFRNLKGIGDGVLKLYRSTDPALSAALIPALRKLDPPALVIWGRHDPYISADYAEVQREAFPRARVVVLEESGHWPFIDDAAAVTRELLGFVRQHAGSAKDGRRPRQEGHGSS